jgi:hypothetical protein
MHDTAPLQHGPQLKARRPVAPPLIERAASEAPDPFAAFKHESFLIRHALGGHPLFDLDRLAGLALRVQPIPAATYWQNGVVEIEDGWRTPPAPQLSLQDTIEGIRTNNSLVILKHVDQDPVFGELMRDLLSEVFARLSAQERADITVGEALIFLTSPGRKTAYHMDLETSLLFQVAGDKSIHVFDRSAGAVVSDLELELHCAGEHSAAIYRPSYEPLAKSYALTPGLGVHLPSLAPHWVQNGDDISISININYDHRSIHHRLKPIYRVNHVLRRLGLTPTPPRVSAWRDELKTQLGAGEVALRKIAKRVLKRRRAAESYAAWSPRRGDGRSHAPWL